MRPRGLSFRCCRTADIAASVAILAEMAEPGEATTLLALIL
jgi:hypothetical protein